MQELLYSIENITVREYFENDDCGDYDIFIDTLNPVNLFAGRVSDLSKLTFDEVEVIKRILNEPTLEDIKDVFISCYDIKGNINESADSIFYNASIFDLFQAKKYIQQYFTKLVETEVKILSGEPDEKMIMINAQERLKPVSHLLTKIRLAEQFSKTPKEIGRWKYNEVLNILIANHINGQIQREYNKLQ